ncbi:MAG: metal ABC transporter permease [Desulfobacteraceae bacterium]|nr:metal ABC transporter permease [Desulfobacteraceae bacterium]MBC2754589.1 metal ABC transporter permease [Desulfobacteraceae bacterium]
MIEALQFEFMRNAVIAGFFASLICGVIGSFVVVNRLVFLAGGIAHAAFGGIGIALFFGVPYMLGTLGFSLLAALIMTAVVLKNKSRADTFIGILWAVGMATGIILLDLTPGYNVNLISYLFGSILAVPTSDIWWMLGLSFFTIVSTGFFYRDLLAISYDDEFAKLRGVPVNLIYFLFIGLIAVSIVILIRVVGLILVIALLTIPPYIAEKYSRSLSKMMILSTILAGVFNLSGLWLAYTYNLTSGATIILVAAAAFFISMIFDMFFLKKHPELT